MLDTAGLIVAEKLERSTTGNGGAAMALPLFKRLLVAGPDAAFSARAALGAMRCIAALGKQQDADLDAVVTYWSTLAAAGDHLPDIIAFCKHFMREGRKAAAVALARAETERRARARAFYLFARCLELAGDADGAFVTYGLAAEKAEKEQGAADVAIASRVKRLGRMIRDKSTLPMALAEARVADPEGASPEGKLMIALGRLQASSKFVRASGLSLLEELGRDPGTSLGRQAIGFAAEHADAMGDALTALEADRIAAALSHVPDEEARVRALERLNVAQQIASSAGEAQVAAIVRAGEIAPEIFPLVCRARAVVSGGGQGAYAATGEAGGDKKTPARERIASLGLDAIVAIGRGRVRETATALVSASVEVSNAGAYAPVLWVAARLALEGSEPMPRDAGARLIEALFDSKAPPPSRGYTALAHALARAGRLDLAKRAAREAAVAKESSARALLGSILRDEGWSLAAKGQREAAIEALREAKEHLLVEAALGKR